MKTIRTIGILLLVMSFFIGCEFEIYSENTLEAKGVNSNSDNTSEKIGDIAYSDGSVSAEYDNTKKPVGIVIEVKNGVATKIVSLTQTSAEWSTENVTTKATSTTDGVANMTAIQSIDGWEEKYPAFKWCDAYTDASGNSEWYLPATEELIQLYKVKDYVNAAINKIRAGGGTATNLDTGYYWSSSQYDSSNFYSLSQRFSDGGRYYDYKTNTISVRAVRAFSMETTIVNRINVVSTSHKTSYKVGESLDVSGLTIEVTRDDGTTKTSNVTSSMISGFDSSIVGTQTLTITYGGCTTTFDVEVVVGIGKIGDIAYSDGSVFEYYDSTKTPVGIVIEATDGVATKIVSLTQTSARWSTEYVDTNATSTTDGAANMTAIQSIDGWEEKYTAFKWCDDYTDESGNSDWYLPAKEELNQLYEVKDYLNTVIEKITAGGGTAVSLGTRYYWSSSQLADPQAWYQSFSDGDQDGNLKNYINSVRAVRAF